MKIGVRSVWQKLLRPLSIVAAYNHREQTPEPNANLTGLEDQLELDATLSTIGMLPREGSRWLHNIVLCAEHMNMKN